jgi:quinol monooxygenase YgiN
MRGRGIAAQLAVSCLAGIVWLAAESASAQTIVRIVTFKVASPEQQPQVLKVTDEITEVFKTSKAFRRITFAFNPETGENVAVSLWTSRAGMEAVAKSEAFKPLLEKMKRLAEGDLTVKTYQAYEPKKK